MSNNNGWDTYSKLVLQQLETLAAGIEALRTELQDVKGQLTELKAKEDKVQELKAWKDKMDDVASPPQIKSALEDIENLKIYKTKAMTAFMVVQGIMAMALAWSKLG
jgi:Tfp pilus assembly protein PilO